MRGWWSSELALIERGDLRGEGREVEEGVSIPLTERPGEDQGTSAIIATRRVISLGTAMSLPGGEVPEGAEVGTEMLQLASPTMADASFVMRRVTRKLTALIGEGGGVEDQTREVRPQEDDPAPGEEVGETIDPTHDPLPQEAGKDDTPAPGVGLSTTGEQEEETVGLRAREAKMIARFTRGVDLPASLETGSTRMATPRTNSGTFRKTLGARTQNLPPEDRRTRPIIRELGQKSSSME